MNYALTLWKEAEFDIGEHFRFYEEKREGLGYDFLLCVEEASKSCPPWHWIPPIPGGMTGQGLNLMAVSCCGQTRKG